MITKIRPDFIPLKSIKDLSPKDEVFYELGYKIDSRNPEYINNWVRTGLFKKISNNNSFLEDELSRDEEYLEHHNFMFIKH